MGVPKFYRWISERYPCLSEVVKEHQVPEFDNLYLDMNGIIHNCSHPQDDDPHFRITEEQIFKDIFNYIEVLFRIIRPRRTFFMAVDGVAPRAKMNQQRGRRFRSAKEAENTIKQALQKGEVLPTEKRFDSNCITPGTHFMEKLQSQLEYFVQTKITNDRNWQGIKVYLSGHQTPGEGEHKIMEFIRYERTQPHYDPNTRHCLYGLDADLMMLGLCTHEPHFALLREEVKFMRRKNSKTQAAAETTFHLLHISLMREYIDHEFSVLKTNLPFEYDIESIIDDWVLMGFLVGNDFIPHLPDLHISTSALPFLYQTYMEVLPQLDGYINEGGTINLQRIQVYLQAISKFDLDHFEEIYSDYKWLESKSKAKKRPPKEVQLEEKSLKIVQDLAESQGMVQPGDFEEDESTFDQEFKLHKQAYYQSKFDIKATEEEISNIAFEYILGIQWICHYYYNGVQSWGWFYPYHYSPYMSDLCNLSTMQLNYEMNQPFLPFQQLLAVLPAASKDCIPEQYWGLMEESSIIGDFYPRNFSTDLNGKQQEWEAVVLIPFIDEKRLLSAMAPCTARLSSSEKRRHMHGPCQVYTHEPNAPHYLKSTLPSTFPDVALCTARKEDVPTGSWLLEDYNNFTKGLLSGCKLSVYYQGFPTLYHLPHKSYLKKQGVKVFQAPSRNENMILRILPPTNGDLYRALLKKNEGLEIIGERLLGQSVYVNWPHMEEAKVISVSDGKDKLTYNEHVSSTQGSKIKLVRKSLEKTEISSFIADQKNLRDSYLDRRGINIGDTRVVIYAQVLLGKKYVCGKKGEVTLEKQWSTSVQPFPVQTVLKDIDVKDQTFKPMTSIAEMLPKNAEVFNIGVPHYGCMGKVCSTHGGNATITFQVPDEPNLTRILKKKHTLSSYHPGWKIASNTGVSGYILSRITGSVYAYFPETRKWSIGLNLKFTKERSGVAGFTKRKDNEWLYSDAVTGLILGYRERFPEVLSYLEETLGKTAEQDLNLESMFGTTNVVEKLQELTKWLKSLPSYGGAKVHESSNTIEPIVVSAIDDEIKLFKKKAGKAKDVTVSVLSRYLYCPQVQQGTLIPDKSATHQEMDRVVNVREGHTVPLGLRGTVIGIHTRGNTEQEMIFDVLFDDEFMGGMTLGGRCPPRKGYTLPVYAVINLSHGDRMLSKNNRPVAVVHPHHQGAQNQPQIRQSPRLIRSPQSAFSPAKKAHTQGPANVTLLQRGKSPQRNSNSGKKLSPSFQEPSVSTSGHRGPKKNLKQGIPQKKEKQTKGKALDQAAQSLPNVNQSQVGTNFDQSKATKQTNPIEDIFSKLALKEVKNENNNNVAAGKVHEEVKQEKETPQVVGSSNAETPETDKPYRGWFTDPQTSESTHFNQLIATLGTPSKNTPQTPQPSNPAPVKQSAQPGTSQKSLEPRKTPQDPNQNHELNKQKNQHLKTHSRQNLPQATNVPQYVPQPRYPHPNQYPKPFSLQEFLSNPPNYPPPPLYPQMGGPLLLGPDSFRPRHFTPHFTPRPQNQAPSNPAKFIKEGTDKLCEILNIGEEEDKSTNDNKQPTVWSTTTADAESNKTTEKENTNETGNDKTSCDRGSDIEEERPTSVEAATLGLKGKTKVDELSLWCRENRVYPPVFTLVVNTETDHITTVDLWNGLKFQSTSKPTLELAKEECASAALTYIHSSQYREQPNPVVYQPTMPAYYVQDANQAFPAFPAMHPIPPPQMMMSPNHVMSQNHVMSSMMPYMQPPVINPYVMGADGLLYPRYFPATKYQYPSLPPGALPRYTPAVPPPRLSGHQVEKGLLHHNPRGHSNSVPKQFVPSQVECHSPSKSINTSSQNYILSDSPLPPSGDKCTTSRTTESRPRKSKATLAISFANST